MSASRGFESLKPVPFSASETEKVRNFREVPESLQDIPKMLFGGFSRCLYPEQKFGSDPERRFAVVLEDEKQGSSGSSVREFDTDASRCVLTS